MSANTNVTHSEKKKKILVIAANPATSTVTQGPVDFWWAELAHPYWAFTEVGYERDTGGWHLFRIWLGVYG